MPVQTISKLKCDTTHDETHSSQPHIYDVNHAELFSINFYCHTQDSEDEVIEVSTSEEEEDNADCDEVKKLKHCFYVCI